MASSTQGIRPGFRLLITFGTAAAGGLLFMFIALPVPWLLGPMVGVLIGSNIAKRYYSWPGIVRNGGMIVVGYTIGISLTATALREIGRQLPAMLLMTALLLVFCAGIAFIVSKISGVNYRTVLLGSIPGGLTQMVLLAEEMEDINITIVTVIQVIRLMMIIICVPLLIFSPLFAGQPAAEEFYDPASASVSASWAGLFPNIFFFAAACIAAGILGQKIKFPTAYLLGPAIIAAILQLFGLQAPVLPAILLNAAQLAIGVFVGLLLDPRKLSHKWMTLSLAVGSGMVLLGGAYALSYLFAAFESVGASTALLSLAPGGMDQMSLIAHEVGADLPTVAGFQIFRTFFIFFAVPPLFKLIFREKKTESSAIS